MRWLSIALSLLTLPLLFLVLPALVFPPAALVTGWISYRRSKHRAGSHWTPLRAAVNAIPMVLALLCGALAWWILATQYRT